MSKLSPSVAAPPPSPNTGLAVDVSRPARPAGKRPRPSATADREQRFQDFADALPVMAWAADADGICDFVNRRWLEFTGGTAEAHLGCGWTDAVHPEDRPRCSEFWAATMREAGPADTEFRVRRHDGEFRWVAMAAVPIGEAGTGVRWCGTLTDIHDLRLMQRALADRETQLQVASSIGGLARYAYHFDTQTFTADVELAGVLGVGTDGLAQSGLSAYAERLHPEDQTTWQLAVGKALRPETGSFEVTYRASDGDGGWRWIRSHGQTRFDDAGRPVSVAGIVQRVPAPAGGDAA